MIESFDALYLTFTFIVPGFIIDFCTKKFIPQQDISDNNRNILYYLCWSSVNYGLWSWLVYLMYKSEYFIGYPIRIAVAGAVIVFVSPVAISLIIIIAYKRGFLQFVSRLLKLNIKHPIPTAWDYKWNSIEEKKWVIVVLDDGSSIGGFWFNHSFASSVGGERDIYLEKIYKISPDDGKWDTVPRNDGMWINGSTIKAIQFMEDEIKGDQIND